MTKLFCTLIGAVALVAGCGGSDPGAAAGAAMLPHSAAPAAPVAPTARPVSETEDPGAP